MPSSAPHGQFRRESLAVGCFAVSSSWHTTTQSFTQQRSVTMNNVNTNNRKETTGNKPTYDHLLPSPPAAFGTQPSALTASGAAFAALPNPAANAVPGLSHNILGH